jgi:hypothetical protein
MLANYFDLFWDHQLFCQVTLSRSFHVVKGLQYKQGQVPTMMIPLIGKDKWKEQHNSVSTFPSSVATGPSTGSRTASVTSSSISSESAERALANAETTTVRRNKPNQFIQF